MSLMPAMSLFRLFLIVLSSLGFLAPSVTTDAHNARYPNELPGFKFFETAKWKSLVPLASSISDVRTVLGNPAEATDLAHYFDPYPGDAKAKAPVFTYPVDDDWEILIYFVSSCGYKAESPDLPRDRLCTIDLIPRKPLPFKIAGLSEVFSRKHITAADAAWDEYRDPFGLTYEIYTTKTPYGPKMPGDLNRIVY